MQADCRVVSVQVPRSSGCTSSAVKQHGCLCCFWAVVKLQYEAAVLCLHRYRGQHGVPALKWDATLAAQAQKYADSCPSGHSGTAGVGENMAWGYSDFNAVVDGWYNEVRSGPHTSCPHVHLGVPFPACRNGCMPDSGTVPHSMSMSEVLAKQTCLPGQGELGPTLMS